MIVLNMVNMVDMVNMVSMVNMVFVATIDEEVRVGRTSQRVLTSTCCHHLSCIPPPNSNPVFGIWYIWD